MTSTGIELFDVREITRQNFTFGALLSQGGMGAVYRGTHVKTGVPVAIKLIRGPVDSRARQMFHREVQAHATLTHPGIVSLFEYGSLIDPFEDDDDAENLFIAMELADGTLRHRMPLTDWPAIHEVLLQILDALAYSHAREVIHRDLKPENLLVFGPDSLRVKLADFGIAQIIAGDPGVEPGIHASPMGTPRYMPIEQLQGKWRELGPWTDLYALGCIAYELICGHAPFEGRKLTELMYQHATAERPPLRPMFSVPEGVDSWIARAFARDPRDRFQRAVEAMVALPRGAGGAPIEIQGARQVQTFETAPVLATTLRDAALADLQGVESASSSPPRSRPQPILRFPSTWRTGRIPSLAAPLAGAGLGLLGLRKPPFVGREAARDEIWEALRRVVETHSFELTLLSGEAGVGKSRLTEWITFRVHETGAANVFTALHSQSGGPNDGLAGLVQRAFRLSKLTPSEVADHLAESLASLPREDPAQREADVQALTELAHPRAEGADDEPTRELENRRQVFALVSRLLRRFARDRPVLLWLDDVQWSAEALGFIEYLQERREEHGSIYVLATVRSDVVADRAPLRARLQGIEQQPQASRIDLTTLTDDEHRALLDQILPLAPGLQMRLLARTEGNPLFTFHLLNHWVDRGALRVGEDGFNVATGDVIDVPDDIHGLWIGRLRHAIERSDFSEPARQWIALELAATLGHYVNADEWRAACDHAGLATSDELIELLVQRGLVRLTDDGWRFAHVLLVDSLLRRADENGRRKTHHRVCADTLERIGARNPEDLAGRVARHLIAAREYERAVAPHLIHVHREYQAGDEQRHWAALTEHRELLDRLDVPEDDPRSFDLEVRRGLLELYAGDTNSAEARVRRVLELSDQKTPITTKIWSTKVYGMCKCRRAEIDEARAWLLQSVELARTCDDAWHLADNLRELGALEIPERNPTLAREYFEASVAAATGLSDPYILAWTELYRACFEYTYGDPEEAARVYERFDDLAHRKGYRTTEGFSVHGKAALARFRGAVDEARALYERGSRLVRVRGIGKTIGTLERASLEVYDAKFDVARTFLERGESLARDISGLRFYEWVDVIWLALAAGTADWDLFDETLAAYRGGWPLDARLSREHPWNLRLAARYAAAAGEVERSRLVAELADATSEILGPGGVADYVRTV